MSLTPKMKFEMGTWVAILGEGDLAIPALSISGPSSRFNRRNDSPVVEKLELAVADISRQLRQHIDI